MLQEENESVLEKVMANTIIIMQCTNLFKTGLSKFILNLEQQLRRAEEKCEEAEARAKELEKQVKLGQLKILLICFVV